MIRINELVPALACSAISATLFLSGCATSSQSPSAAIKAPLAPLPETVTSFGAVTAGDWLYAFGGHKGERHEYSIEMVSGSFQRLNLHASGQWETLPAATPGQGQP